ncbi:MAG: response regulator [Bacillota bacterium]
MKKDNINILVIDDEPEIIYTFTAVAEIESWNVEGANNPHQGINLALSGNFDVILVDFHMPEMTGLEVVEKIRENNSELKIIVLTIDERYEIAQKFLKAGADDYALKPIKAADLISRIKAHIRTESRESLDLEKLELPKGLSITTLQKIYNEIKDESEFLTIEKVCEKTGFAYQTVHRYMEFFEKEKLAEVDLEYGNIGRPTKKYRVL